MGYVRNGPETPEQKTLYPPPIDPDDFERERVVRPSTRQDHVAIASGSSLEAIGGAIAIVLSIIGIASTFTAMWMAGIATIAIGVGLVALGASFAARRLAARRRQDEAIQRELDQTVDIELVGGMGTELFGGLVGIVLGILALARVDPLLLLPIAAIVFGGALLLGGPTQPELERFAPADVRYRRLTHEAIHASGGVMAMVGVAAAVLGILALLGVGPQLILSLVALLCVGASLVMGGSALTARFVRRFS
ncbi:MAG TPA: hypothetical protein VLX92_20980 [Kofleriaceae bacterium]|nr:hypothetical protein [Kofleriaceae bacterium]